MLSFPVSLLTATAFIEGIKRVIRRRLPLTESKAPIGRPESTSDCPMKHAAPGVTPRSSILEHESSDVELDVLRATSVVYQDIREVLGLSLVTISYIMVVIYILIHFRRNLMAVRNGSNGCDRLQKSHFARNTS